MAIKGFLEVIAPNSVSGWCYDTDASEPLVVRLFVDDIPIRSRRADNERSDIERGGGQLLSGFNFQINPNLLQHLPKRGRVRVLVGDDMTELPLLQGKSNEMPGGADDGGARLKEMLASKYHIDHWGSLQISFAKEPGKKERMLDFYCEMRALFRIYEGIDIYLTGGNLLGLIREFDFLGHDDDVDAAFTVEADTPAEAARLFFNIFGSVAPKLYATGYEIKLVDVGHFHVFRKGIEALDVFLGWITRDKYWYRFVGAGGYLGTGAVRTREIDYLGRKVLIPQYPERELDLTYRNWREPDPHFYWNPEPAIKTKMRELQAAGASDLRRWQAKLADPERHGLLVARAKPYTAS